MIKKENPVIESIAEISALTEIHPQVVRVGNCTSARVAALLSALAAALAVSGTACGGTSEANDYQIVNCDPDSGVPDAAPEAAAVCSPVPDCPTVPVSYLSANGEPNDNYYLEMDRWFRMDPQTKEVYKVCEPVHNNICAQGQVPENDKCNPPACKNAVTCDPVPGRKSAKDPLRYPLQSNIPIGSSGFGFPNLDPYFNDRNLDQYPVIFDKTPDCANGESPKAESYLTCDPIPTCAQTIAYCDPMPRCAAGQSPVYCEESANKNQFTTKEDCLNDGLIGLDRLLLQHGINVPGQALCEEKIDETSGKTFYSIPAVRVVCRHIPECKDGETPVTATVTYPLNCGKWFSGETSDNYAPSCDPIKSCK